MLPQESLIFLRTCQLKIKACKNAIHVNSNQKRVGEAILVSEKDRLKIKTVIKTNIKKNKIV
jgi:hypothetical protein